MESTSTMNLPDVFQDESPLRNLLAAIVESSEDAIIGKNLDGVILTWNKSAERMFGYSAEEAVGQHISLIIPPERLQEEFTIINNLKQGRKIEHFETVRRRKNGDPINISITVSPIRNAEGVVIGASKVARDISERIYTQEILKEEARNKDEFLAVLAHELRNPLAPLKNVIEILNLKTKQTPDEEWALGVMNRQIGQMSRLIDDLLDVARISSKKLELHTERINMNDVVTMAIETSKPGMDSAGQHFTALLPSKAIFINGDRARLAQVISNVLNNASKYTPAGGNITLSVERKWGSIVIRVTDDGMGIPPEVLPKIFNMFTQAQSVKENVKGGLGIGLTLVKELVELHGGIVTVESEVGKGSTFTIQIPLRDSAEEKALAADAIPENSMLPSNLRVLIVDDNKDATDSLKKLLHAHGALIKVGYDGFEAYQQAESFRPDVILLDIGMPKINGLELAQMIRRQTWGENMMLVATTGWGQDEDKHRSEVAGFDYHFVKPINFSALKELLMKITPQNSEEDI